MTLETNKKKKRRRRKKYNKNVGTCWQTLWQGVGKPGEEAATTTKAAVSAEGGTSPSLAHARVVVRCGWKCRYDHREGRRRTTR